MELYEWLTIALLIVLIAEVTYLLSTKNPTKIKRGNGRVTLLDSSALIDGRILEVVKAGFLPGALIVPKSVIAELQLLADGGDHEKRSRARYGLDVIKELQQMKNVDIQVLQDGKAKDGVDDQLIDLAKQYNAHILTLDFNLNKVAQVENIGVLNINELAQTLRMSHLPGERRKLHLVQRGNESDQAVGYLEDGTMVVVEKAKGFVGKDVDVEFTRSLQTQAGKMMFAKKISNNNDTQPKPVATTKKDTKKTFKPVKKYSSNKRKPSKEDSLVELANR